MLPKILLNIPLAPLATFGLGGRAERYLRASSPEQLVDAVQLARAKRWRLTVFAGGSNVVFSDNKITGLVVHFFEKRGKIVGTGGRIEASAGLALGRLIRGSQEHSLAGLEALAGIPGTVGGALVGNAGAYGQSISDHLIAVQIWDGKTVRWLKKSACEFTYRHSIFKKEGKENWLILRAKFKLKTGNKKELLKKSREIIKIRTARYPLNLKCPGSFFQNILVKEVARKSLAKIDRDKIRDGKIPAGWLLEQAGALNRRVGDIYVSDWHGNLIINNGRGTYRDVKKLATILKNLVWKKFGIKLEEEVRYL